MPLSRVHRPSTSIEHLTGLIDRQEICSSNEIETRAPDEWTTALIEEVWRTDYEPTCRALFNRFARNGTWNTPTLHRYHGVLAPNARLRSQVIALRPSEVVDPPLPADDESEPSEARGSQAAEGSPSSGRSARIRWAQLLARIYEVLPLLCPSCGGQMRILAFLTDPPVIRSILVHLDLSHRPPPVAPARGPPQGDFLLDQSPEV